MSNVHVIITGPTGSGKSAIYGEIEIALKAIGVEVRHADPVAVQSEKNMTHADWQDALDLYKPTVVLHEINGATPAGSVLSHLLGEA